MPAGDFTTRRDLIEIGRRLHQKGFLAANDGNLSARLSSDRVLVTAGGTIKGFLTHEDFVAVDLAGRVIEGGRRPSSEIAMHLAIYRLRSDARAVVHAHPPIATGFAVAGVPLALCVLPEVVVTLGSIPLAEYAVPSTEEVARSIEPHLKHGDAVLLRNHGAVTLAADPFEAYYRMERVEHFAYILLVSRLLGNVGVLDRGQVRELMKQHGRDLMSLPCEVCDAASRAAPGPGGAAAGADTPLRDEDLAAIIAESVRKALEGG
jgi:L-fuculose-phosphate aldolase